jgi:ABC-type taurine transport system ATPase subunit
LVAQTVGLVKMALCEESWLTLASPMSALHRAIFTQKQNMLVGVECKLNNKVTTFTISTLSELLVAPIIIVGDKNGIWM